MFEHFCQCGSGLQIQDEHGRRPNRYALTEVRRPVRRWWRNAAEVPRSVAFPQLRLASVEMTSFRRDLHPQDSAHAGRTKKERAPSGARDQGGGAGNRAGDEMGWS